MEWIGVIGIIVGLVFFVVAAMKGWNVLITSIVTAIIIALTNGMDIMNSMVGTEKSYVTGLAGFIRGNLLIFMGGAIMGEFMDKSGAAKAIAQAIMAKVGSKSPYFVLLGISAVGALLTYAGISMFVAMFALIPLARPMFRECNIPWHLFCAAWTLGACSFTMAMIPGVPAVAWINASNGCGVSLTAAPIMGIVGSIIAIAVSCVYIKFALKRAEAKGEHYVADDDDKEVEADTNIPPLGLALLPLIVLIAVIIGLSATGMKNVVYIGMVCGVIASIICFFKYLPGAPPSSIGRSRCSGRWRRMSPTSFPRRPPSGTAMSSSTQRGGRSFSTPTGRRWAAASPGVPSTPAFRPIAWSTPWWASPGAATPGWSTAIRRAPCATRGPCGCCRPISPRSSSISYVGTASPRNKGRAPRNEGLSGDRKLGWKGSGLTSCRELRP